VSSFLTESQFAAVQDKIDNLARAARKGTDEERAAFAALSAAWEAAYALPVRTPAQRETRLQAIVNVAVKHNLL
jgi:hypothetical protein